MCQYGQLTCKVLLRVLEYYDGILILTTNRIKTFDIAVQSRVNFAINYQKLNDNQKKVIYQTFIKQLKEDDVHNLQSLVDWPKSDDWETNTPFERLNGRRIRNVLFSAASFAQTEGDRKLKLDHIKKFEKETTAFDNDTHNILETARAAAEVGYDKG